METITETKEIISDIDPQGMSIDCWDSSSILSARILFDGTLIVRFRSSPMVEYHYEWNVSFIVGALSRNLASVGRFVAEVKANADSVTRWA